RVKEDIDIIASLAPHYRMSLMWSKLQREPFGQFDADATRHYHELLGELASRGTKIMMVLHHFTNPNWFAKRGGWEKEENIALWVDFSKKLVDEFGRYVSSWNTFNEPNVYASFGWVVSEFPPFKNNILAAVRVIRNMSAAHSVVYDYIKEKYSHPVGISNNAAVFSAENFLGWFPAKLSDLWFMEFVPRQFDKVDFFGMSYYARISHDPFPINYIQTPEKFKKLGKDHDDMWEYYPQGLNECLIRYWNQYKKPIIITENGVCTGDDQRRVSAIQDYLKIIYDAIQTGVDVQGYYYWSTWDNFEWRLGPTYKFGLYGCDFDTKQRIKRPSADLFAKVAHTNEIYLKPQSALNLV
ncbi:MAG: family 1 glycosylhydrolase, partial [Bacteroidota bacterium]